MKRDIDLAQGTGKCNCTFCTLAWKAFVRPAAFRLLGGGDHVAGYNKHPQSSLKYFCQECGVRAHELGSADYMEWSPSPASRCQPNTPQRRASLINRNAVMRTAPIHSKA
jgi:hypothetical protein